MAAVVWFAVGAALWHFTVIVPDRFWGGIVGALLGALTGAMVSGAIFQVILGRTIGQTDLITVFVAAPGAIAGLWVIWMIGVRGEAERAGSARAAGG